MNYAKKVRDLEKIYFNDSKEYENNKIELLDVQKKYEELQSLCKELLNNYDNKNDIEMSIVKIKYHLMDKS